MTDFPGYVTKTFFFLQQWMTSQIQGLKEEFSDNLPAFRKFILNLMKVKRKVQKNLINFKHPTDLYLSKHSDLVNIEQASEILH